MTDRKQLKLTLATLASLGLPLVLPLPAETAGGWTSAGPLFHRFNLTLESGARSEWLGPLYYDQHSEDHTQSTWALPPLWSYEINANVDSSEWDTLYPLLTYDRFGSQYRWQLMQLLSFSGGAASTETNVHRQTLFPFFFRQTSSNPDRNYTAVVPFYGHLQNRLFRDKAFFVMWPLYVRSHKRDVVTHNVVYPVFHYRYGNGLRGWQFWPLFGTENKEVTYRTNHWDEIHLVGGHRKQFTLWPVYFHQTTGIGTTNTDRRTVVLPLFSYQNSDLRRAWTAPWPLGISYANDRELKYREWGAPWPLVVVARGEGKRLTRFLPLYSWGRTQTLEQGSLLWPIYNYRHIRSAPLDRRRHRILFFLYTDVKETNTETGSHSARRDLWPLWTHRRDHQGNRQLQILAPLEPILPHSKSIRRNYSPLWALWRSRWHGKNGDSSHSLLWNLYRRETRGSSKKSSLLFGLFQYQSHPEGREWRLFYVPFGIDSAGTEPSAPN